MSPVPAQMWAGLAQPRPVPRRLSCGIGMGGVRIGGREKESRQADEQRRYEPTGRGCRAFFCGSQLGRIGGPGQDGTGTGVAFRCGIRSSARPCRVSRRFSSTLIAIISTLIVIISTLIAIISTLIAVLMRPLSHFSVPLSRWCNHEHDDATGATAWQASRRGGNEQTNAQASKQASKETNTPTNERATAAAGPRQPAPSGVASRQPALSVQRTSGFAR